MQINKENVHFHSLNNYIRQLLELWYSSSFLELKKIDWMQTSASVIEYLMKNETVHPEQSIEKFRQRLLSNSRRCYGLYHKSVIDKPAGFVMIALDPDKIFEDIQVRKHT